MKTTKYQPEEAKITPGEKFVHIRTPMGVATFYTFVMKKSITKADSDQLAIGWSFCNTTADRFNKTWGRVLARRRALCERTGIVQPYTAEHKSAEAIVECFNTLMPVPRWMNGLKLGNKGQRIYPTDEEGNEVIFDDDFIVDMTLRSM